MVATSLSIGGLAIIGYNTGQSTSLPVTEDRFSFVVLEAIGAGTQIFFTDRSWNGSAFAAASSGEGTFTYTAATDIAAGTVITVTQAQLTAAGIDINHTTGETLYVYQGAINAPTNFVYAADIADGNTAFSGSLANTGLTAGVTAVAIAYDSAAYAGPTTYAESFLWNGSGSTLLHSIGDFSNWTGSDAGATNAQEQEIQTGPWLVHAGVEFWGTMGSGGLANTLADPTFAGGSDDFNHTRQYEGVIEGQTIFWYATDIIFDTVDGKFFVVDSDISGGHNRILQGSIADLIANPTSVPNLTILYQDPGTTTASRLDNIDLDLANNLIYFTHGGQLLRVAYDTASQTPTVLFDANVAGNLAGSTNNFFNDMVINFVTGSVYLSSTRVLSGASGDVVSRNFIYELTGLTTSSGANAFVFNGTNTGTARLLPFAQNDDSFNPNGGTTASPATAANQAYFWPLERGTLDGLAINPATNTLYFSTGEILFDHDLNSGTAPIYAGGVIASYALGANAANGGANAATILYQQTAQFAGAIPGIMGDLEIDLQNGHLYVLDYNGINGVNDDNHWYRMDIGGSVPIQFTQTIGDIDGTATIGLTLNHAPTLTGTGLAPSVTEASSSSNSGETTLVSLFSGTIIADVDTTTADEISGAVIRISNNLQTGAGHQDYLRINGAISGTIAGSGIAFTYNIATGAMVLTGAATVAEYQAAIQLVTFSTSGDNVTAYGTAGTRQIAVSVSDGLTMSDEIFATVSVTGINDAPVNTAGAAMNFAEDTAGNAASVPPVNAVTGISVFDADANPATQVITVTLTVPTGTLTIRTDVAGGLSVGAVSGNGTGTLVLTGTQNQINATLAAVNGSAQANGLVFTAPANFNGTVALTIVTNDGGFSGNDPGATGTGTSEQDSDVKTINILAVNDPVTTTAPVSLTLAEDAANVAITGMSISDIDATLAPAGVYDVTLSSTNGTVTLTTLTGLTFTSGDGTSDATMIFHGTLAAINAALSTASYTPAANYNGPAQITLQATDTFGGIVAQGSGAATNDSDTISVTVTSVNDAPAGTDNTLVFNEDGSRTLAQADFGFNDVDGGTLTGVIITTLPGAGVLLLNGSAITVAGTFVTAAQIAAGQLVFQSNPNENGVAYATLTFQVRDNGGTANGGQDTDQSPNTLTFDVTAVNDAPTLALADASVVGKEDTDLVFSAANGNGITIGDIDSPILTISLNVAHGTLTLSQTTGLSFSVGDGTGDGAMTFSGSVADINAALNGLLYRGVLNYKGSDALGISVGDSTATVNGNVVITLLDEAAIVGTPGDDNLVGTPQADFFDLSAGGSDTASGLGSNDGFYFGGALSSGDIADGGAGNDDQVGLQGNYASGLIINAANFPGIETFALLGGNVTNFGDTAGNFYDYNLTTTGSFGRNIIVNANGLRAGEDFTFNGSAEATGSFTFYGGFGVETLTGGGGNDGFYFGPGRYAAGDTVNGGGGTDNQLGLRGDYIIDFNAPGFVAPTTNIQTIALLSDRDPNFSQIGDGEFDYNIILANSMVGAGQQLTVSGGGLAAAETMTLDGSQVTGGVLRLIGGAAADTLKGGGGADTIFGGLGADSLTGNGGADTFVYSNVNQSVSGGFDSILDFTHDIDKLNLSAIDANSLVAGDQAFNFVGSAAFTGTGSASAGELRAYQVDATTNLWQVEADTNGDGIADFLLQLTILGGQPVTVGDFFP